MGASIALRHASCVMREHHRRFVAKWRKTQEFAMEMQSRAVRIMVIVLAVIGTLVMLGGAGMVFMHGAMMGSWLVTAF
jgi:hypothetical protein